ncbi:hypothetical protein BT93_B1168 [Corymbia citriodora subsp. variegata]|nr:hypothetical protein BT93_B1168 [Corymbia citriodora subsp. variegata]
MSRNDKGLMKLQASIKAKVFILRCSKASQVTDKSCFTLDLPALIHPVEHSQAFAQLGKTFELMIPFFYECHVHHVWEHDAPLLHVE